MVINMGLPDDSTAVETFCVSSLILTSSLSHNKAFVCLTCNTSLDLLK